MRPALFLLGLFLAGECYAGIGSVTELSGSAQIKRGKETISVAKGAEIEMNDKIETKNGSLTIIFKDDTSVKVTEHSALVIDDFVYDPKSGAGKLGLKAAAGTVRYASGKIAHNDPKSVNIKTPTASIAVRGTDFVMAENEIGSSMVILMPNAGCDPMGGKCSSGRIDVNSGNGTVTMDKPFQATMVETLGAAPSPPIVVSLTGMTIGTNLLLNQPKTEGGKNIVAAARAAVDKTNDRQGNKDGKDDKDDKDHGKEEQQASKDQQDKQRQGKVRQEQEDGDRNRAMIDTKSLDIAVTDLSTGNDHVYKVWKDASQTLQVGWGYTSTTQNAGNFVDIKLPMDSQALVIVTQDRQTDAYNFNSQSSKSYGTIVINQSYR